MMAQVLFFDIFSKKICTLMLLSESNIQNSELNKVTSPLSKVPLCEKQSTEIHKKYHNNYITFTDNNKQVLPEHPFPKVICLLVGDSVLAGTKKIKTWKTQGQRKILLRCSYSQHVLLNETTTKEIAGLHYFAH